LIAPVRHELTVPLPPALAFDLFLNRMGEWWPLLTHSVWQETSRTCTVDVRPGGRITEHGSDGATTHWGTVLELEEAARVLIDWHPGHSPAESTEVEIWFAPHEGGTRLVLEHRNWERRADGAETMRDSYQRGWAMVLGRYLDRAAASATVYSK
jgi:hypothetical protein